MGDGPIDRRSSEDIADDVTACLMIIGPPWARAMDPFMLPGWVKMELEELEANARRHGLGATGCMVVEYDAEQRKTTWSVTVATRWDEDGSRED